MPAFYGSVMYAEVTSKLELTESSPDDQSIDRDIIGI